MPPLEVILFVWHDYDQNPITWNVFIAISTNSFQRKMSIYPLNFINMPPSVVINVV